MLKARVVEVFLSIQGEGLLLGTPMIFARFGGCNLRCLWCDEPDALALSSGKEAALDEVIGQIGEQGNADGPRWVSLTGGEPLMQAAFLEKLCPALKGKDFKILLETAGVLGPALKKVAPWVDLISMDIKLDSALDPSWKPNFNGHGQDIFDRHAKFLEIAPQKTYVKIVVTDQSQEWEILDVLRLLKKFPGVPLIVFQPVTPTNGIKPPSQERLKDFMALAWEQLPQVVRLMPQYHPVWKLA
ncbi:MAG: 7-carboxy-7-deazaguanine synthase QueE [Elusimicrobia bacterium]|nr:7-carboxy-7-deazaguanine synthase QueE [Elusimicrobiota bacterium]